MAYKAKLAAKQYIWSCINTTLAELNVIEKFSDFLQAVKEEHEKELTIVSKELQCVKDIVIGHSIDIDDHIAFSHAIYADELVVLTMADMQLCQLSKVHKKMIFGSDSDETDESTCDSSDVDLMDLDCYNDVKYNE